MTVSSEPPRLEHLLAEHPFLTGLAQQYLEIIALDASMVFFEKNEHLLLEGREANKFFLVVEGQIVLKSFLSASEGYATIQNLEQGEIVGWSWLVAPYRWQFSAFAVKPTTAIQLNGRRLRAACEADPAFGYEIQKRLLFVIGQRLRRTRKQVGQGR